MSNLLEHRVSLVDELLKQQGSLGTAVMRFSDWHEEQAGVPSQERFYKKLMPMGKPGVGHQFAFEVNLDQCTGCKACVVACHSLNGLDEEESWRDVGMLVGTRMQPYVQTVTTACHHCVDPACANGCPVLAYEKDDVTGIVRHLDDQCIGCSYCVMKCPYDVPKWNSKKGIVRKCDMCSQRLAVGEAPACVQACPSEAIAIRIVDQGGMGKVRMLPTAFDSSYTQPTTSYVSDRVVPQGARDFGDAKLRLEDAHWPLAWMLVLTQMAMGLFGVGLLLPVAGGMEWGNRLAVGVLGIGIGLSVLHLGQPMRAWRCFLGLRKSWLSREIVVFGGFLMVGLLAAVFPGGWTTGAAALVGVVGVFCSVMVYADTRRVLWNLGSTAWSFFGTGLLLGCAGGAAVMGWMGPSLLAIHLGFAATVVRTGLFVRDRLRLRGALMDEGHENHRSARKMVELKGGVVRARAVLFGVSTLLGLMGMVNAGGLAAWWATGSVLSTVMAQVLERHLFFVAVESPRMVSNSWREMH
ncbi:molybdopterin oxidoreductase [Phragmitibacter flavus]|uniref:Molybdopterin oxidoreductase n=1 Tax=Phragmitibacter flavus TaxID=2576071 RepID=A0A5R8KCZ3_9BACT|nr:DmsC/YnfH family molybdoenzyme membrane anchor subunit [Phragmitibacter flavus]TLD70176.1 molybdopterin oxidoreductase [Phragmitibacter flavus]